MGSEVCLPVVDCWSQDGVSEAAEVSRARVRNLSRYRRIMYFGRARERRRRREKERENLDLSTCGNPEPIWQPRAPTSAPPNLTIKIESAVVLPNEPFPLSWN